LRKLYEKRITPSVAVEEVAKEHIAENPNYYSDLQNMESIKRQAETMPTTAPYDMMFPFGNKRLADINKVSYEKNADLKLTDIREFEDGGISGRICGCKNHKRKYLDGGMFDSGFGSLDSFIGQNQKKDESSKNAEYSLEVIEKARKLLDKDYLPMILSSSMSDKYKIYFQHLKKLNLYQDGWRFKFGQSREWAGLCAYNGLVFDKKKTLYLSINYVKHDNNWLENEKDVVLHEMAHAIVDEYIITKIADFGGLDPAHKLTEGHGEAWEQVCKAINPDGDCGRFYTNAQLKDSFQPYMYDCGFCGTKKYSRNRNFTNICFKCNKPVIVIKND
jgi:predicted SprT family Zn-dependent metalloprotease